MDAMQKGIIKAMVDTKRFLLYQILWKRKHEF